MQPMNSTTPILIQPPSAPRWLLFALATIMLVLVWPTLSAAQTQNKASLILHLRHAIAPGGGDPAHFDVNDCRTQRNLSDQGREQSRQIGEQLKALGIAPTQVWSSQWCRSVETAKLMGVGEVKPLPALNSFFQNPSAGPAQIAELQTFIRELDPKGGPYVMVSHQVVVSGLNNTFAASGDGVWMVLTGDPNEPWRTYPANTQTLSLPPGF
jgi:phosphohistidine phosphatase SixA